MQCQEKMKKNKQPEGKTKEPPEEIGAESRMRRHIHSLKSVSSEGINLFFFSFNYQDRKQQLLSKKDRNTNCLEKKQGCKDISENKLKAGSINNPLRT